MRQGNIGQHPVIVLTNPDASGRVQITTMSHSHPNNPPTKPASTYGLPIDPLKGESTVNVGTPYTIHISFLRANVPHTRMHPVYFAELRNEICKCLPLIMHVILITGNIIREKLRPIIGQTSKSLTYFEMLEVSSLWTYPEPSRAKLLLASSTVGGLTFVAICIKC